MPLRGRIPLDEFGVFSLKLAGDAAFEASRAAAKRELDELNARERAIAMKSRREAEALGMKPMCICDLAEENARRRKYRLDADSGAGVIRNVKTKKTGAEVSIPIADCAPAGTPRRRHNLRGRGVVRRRHFNRDGPKRTVRRRHFNRDGPKRTVRRRHFNRDGPNRCSPWRSSSTACAGRYIEPERRELRSTIAKAAKNCGDDGSLSTRRLASGPNRRRRNATPFAPAFQPGGVFRGLIKAGGYAAAFDDLRTLSPVKIPDACEEQAQAQLQTLFSDVPGVVWAGELFETKMGYVVASVAEWRGRFRKHRHVPQFFMANPVTGLCENGGYRNAATVASFRHAVVEIDSLPLEVQAAFWVGVAMKRLLPLRSLVHSGGKSIHGIVRLRDDAKELVSQWNALSRCLADDPDSRYRIDVQCRDAARMSRLAGALRADTGRRQELLWLARPERTACQPDTIAPDAPETAFSARGRTTARVRGTRAKDAPEAKTAGFPRAPNGSSLRQSGMTCGEGTPLISTVSFSVKKKRIVAGIYQKPHPYTGVCSKNRLVRRFSVCL